MNDTSDSLEIVESLQKAGADGSYEAAEPGYERPWERLDPDLAVAIAPALPAIASEILDEIARVVEVYRRPLDGALGVTIRAGVEEGLNQFLERIGRPGPQVLRNRNVYAGLGRGELRAGRGLDALQSAYRAGVRVAWRRMSSAARAAGADAATVSLLAESMFAYMDEISAESVDGYAQAQAAVAGEQQRLRQRLVLMIVGDDPPAPGALGPAAAAAGWPPPRVLAALAVREEDVPRLAGRLGVLVIAARVGELTCALIPDPDAPGRREQLARALDGQTAAIGPSMPLADARRSFRLARDALALAEAGTLPVQGLFAVEDHLVALLLAREPGLMRELTRRRLAPLEPLGQRAAERLLQTLVAWLRAQGSVAEVAEALGVHPQTVRYRLARLRELFGPALDDPDVRFELELVLRASGASVRT